MVDNNNRVLLGEGEFGKVYQDGFFGAVKEFKPKHSAVARREAFQSQYIRKRFNDPKRYTTITREEHAPTGSKLYSPRYYGTLEDVLKKSPGATKEERQTVKKYVREALKGIRKIHRKGLVHNDFNPKNIFFDAENNVLIGDFGTLAHGDENEQVKELRMFFGHLDDFAQGYYGNPKMPWLMKKLQQSKRKGSYRFKTLNEYKEYKNRWRY